MVVEEPDAIDLAAFGAGRESLEQRWWLAGGLADCHRRSRGDRQYGGVGIG
ncbi:hypothetical protein I551_6495 [Mycobacterium ulcerans str. Harvey]|uniref:Uncharacterized protein n=1 Tax=Mycobacterium ulcerans str. Harvey TaxID=1299332 RepID=A0ABP3AB70_MYCUL|nr:hypothetical protein I551_6495 [Mycobacterium ulcerans str. Harvey]